MSTFSEAARKTQVSPPAFQISQIIYVFTFRHTSPSRTSSSSRNDIARTRRNAADAPFLSKSVFEVAHTGKQHRNMILIRLGDGIIVPDTAARLNNSLDTIFGSESHAVIEREESI